MATDDAQTDLKKRARRRLVGAAALALLAIIILPMVMDPAPKPLGEDIQVRIPSQDGENFAQRKIELPSPPAMSPMAAPADAPKIEPSPEPVAAAPVKPVAADKPEPKPVTQKAPEDQKPAPTTTTTTATTTTDERARVEAILAGKLLKPEAPATGEAFVVQLGAYSNADSATNQANKVRERGFKVFTQKVGTSTRVRVGPYGSRDAAEKAADQLEKAGFKGVVMARG
ncbi:SPOR domain-containing protein [Denitromonas halophila]|uniref:SPOR domain-containing protein n=1 Tax=Denitromonas halophila TaxID=1629404 RepID=A0A557QYQ2_9RHOO|nr:SPOR domain-containing protein [Denitromonas halophila]TVO58039.1 SPOR domain-containing protein [Denitromonas halophila]